MKLPDDKKERTKVLVLIVMGAVLAVVGLYMGVIKPVFKGKAERAEKIEELDTKLTKANRAIALMPKVRKNSAEVLIELDQVANHGKLILEDRLGNFLLGASEVIETHARRFDLQIESIKENGISQIPQSTTQTEPVAFNAYTVTVRILCGAHDLLNFLGSLEQANPYLCVSALNIVAQAGKPAKHMVTMEVQWPIWTNPKMPSLLAEQIQSMNEDAAESDSAPPADPAAEGETQP